MDPLIIPHWAPPTHAMQIFRYAEQGSIEFLWISATNPAVSMPELPRIRDILAKPELFLVVQDLYLTETAQLPTSCFPARVGAKRPGLHQRQPHRAPLGQGRRTAGRGPQRPGYLPRLLPPDGVHRRWTVNRCCTWAGPEEAFEAWKECSRGRPCDYTGISYERLRGGSGIPWPCNEE